MPVQTSPKQTGPQSKQGPFGMLKHFPWALFQGSFPQAPRAPDRGSSSLSTILFMPQNCRFPFSRVWAEHHGLFTHHFRLVTTSQEENGIPILEEETEAWETAMLHTDRARAGHFSLP